MKKHNENEPEKFNDPALPDLADLTPELPDLADLTPNFPDLEAIERLQAAQIDAIDEAMHGAPQSTAEAEDAMIEAQSASLLERVPGLLPDEARQAIAEDMKRREAMNRPPFREDGQVSLTAVSNAHRILRSRLIKANAATVEAVYAVACIELEAVGASFELLAAWHRGER